MPARHSLCTLAETNVRIKSTMKDGITHFIIAAALITMDYLELQTVALLERAANSE